jgi:hypothetical protein
MDRGSGRRRTNVFGAALLGGWLLGACATSRPSEPIDLTVPDDLTVPPDLRVVDLAMPDLSRDLSPPLDLTAGPPANAADTCTSAPELPLNLTVTGQSTSPLTDTYNQGSCFEKSLTYTGKDGTYKTTIPAGKMLTVVVTPAVNQGFDPAVAIVSGCSNLAQSCLKGIDVGGVGAVETVQYTNPGTAPLPVFILVDAWSGSASGDYSIRAELQ